MLHREQRVKWIKKTNNIRPIKIVYFCFYLTCFFAWFFLLIFFFGFEGIEKCQHLLECAHIFLCDINSMCTGCCLVYHVCIYEYAFACDLSAHDFWYEKNVWQRHFMISIYTMCIRFFFFFIPISFSTFNSIGMFWACVFIFSFLWTDSWCLFAF